MTDFLATGTLPDHYEQLAKTVRDFAQSVVAPVAAKHDEEHSFPYEVVSGMADMGLFGLPFPEEYGGMGGDYFALCLALEELGKVDQSVAITLEAGVSLGAMPVYRFGNEDQKQEWLPLLASGKALGAFGLTEAGGGTDAGATKTTARLDDGALGHQRQQAVHHQLGHRHHQAGDGHRGHRRSRRPEGDLVDPGAGAHRGLHRRARLQQGRLERLGHPSAELRRRAGARREPARRARPRLRQLPAHPRRGPHRDRRAVGRRRAGLRRRVREVRQGTRRRSARRIGTYQAISFKIARMEARAHAARTAYYDAAALMLAGKPFKKAAAIAKLVASEAAMDNARDATQVFGGYGFMNEYPVARHYRDSKILEIGEGTTEVQLMLIAREAGL